MNTLIVFRHLMRLVAVVASCEGFCEPLTLVELIRFGLGTLYFSRLGPGSLYYAGETQHVGHVASDRCSS